MSESLESIVRGLTVRANLEVVQDGGKERVLNNLVEPTSLKYQKFIFTKVIHWDHSKG